MSPGNICSPVSWVAHLVVRERPSRKPLQTDHQSLLFMSVDVMSKDDFLEKFKFYVDLASEAKDLGLRAVPVQYGLDGPVVRARTRAIKHLVNQLDGRQMGWNHPSNTV